ncbi:uncharacterized protein LOC125647911 [Ostrea edulis]|uniref:uncharacterized protein LOC125647911 n=1 Tax=Ostrea edulis TaxID=37623 RepID=UPI0020961E5F|nr:uncharacterized protein LOC125647911 [Ostrea edulis]
MILTIATIVCGFYIHLSLECEATFYDIPGRRYHISKAYDTISAVELSYCRQRCAADHHCWAFMYYNNTELCALTNISVIFGYFCDYCFSARKSGCVTSAPTTSSTPQTTPQTTAAATLCTCTCVETNTTIHDAGKERISSLRINRSELSSTKRKLISKDDQRPSAKGIGYVAIFVLCFAFGTIVLFDCMNFYHHCKKMIA